MRFDAKSEERPALHVASLRHVGPYHEIGPTIERIVTWAVKKGLFRPPQTQLLAVYYDDPETTDVTRLRADACVTVPEGTSVDGEVKILAIPGGRFAVARVEIDGSEFGAAWQRLVNEWMPEHGVEPDISPGRLCYEIYLNDSDQHPEKLHIVELCEPIRAH